MGLSREVQVCSMMNQAEGRRRFSACQYIVEAMFLIPPFRWPLIIAGSCI